jgi:hypothetical protein
MATAREEIRSSAADHGWTVLREDHDRVFLERGSRIIWVYFSVRGAVIGADPSWLDESKDWPTKGKRGAVLAWLAQAG